MAKRWRNYSCVLWLAGVSLAAKCEAGGVGDPCIPEVEYQALFGGHSVHGADVESRSFQCETRLCLVNHFQGRVNCPYGQALDTLDRDPSAPARCRFPGSEGSHSGEVATVPVRPWLIDRPASEAVYCSCRCDGPESGGDYCECPSGFSCQELIPDLGDNQERLIGSYCVRNGTEYREEAASGVTCLEAPEHPNCPGEAGANP